VSSHTLLYTEKGFRALDAASRLGLTTPSLHAGDDRTEPASVPALAARGTQLRHQTGASVQLLPVLQLGRISTQLLPIVL